MEKLTNVLKGIMLCMFALLMLCALLLGAFWSLSYIVAFALAAVCAIAVWLLAKRLTGLEELLDRLGAVKTGVILSMLCFVLNLAVILIIRVAPIGDYDAYWTSATDLAAGRALEYQSSLALFPHIIGYSSLIAALIKVFGASPMLAPFVNLGLTVISGLLIYILCLRWRGLKTAAAAGLLWSVCPSKALFNAQVLSEPLYTCLILLFLFIITEVHLRLSGQRKELWLWALCAIVCGVLLTAINAARPIAAVPLIAFFIWVLVLRSDEIHDRRRWAAWALFALLLCASNSLSWKGWQNHVEKTIGEEPAFNYGYSIYVGFNTAMEDYYGAFNPDDMAALGDYYSSGLSAPEAQSRILEDAKARIFSGNIDFGKLFSDKLRILLGCDECGAHCALRSVGGTKYAISAVISNVYYYFIVLFALLGAFRLWKAKYSGTALILPMFVLGLSLAHMLVEVAVRYHYSIIPMLTMLAAFAVEEKFTVKSSLLCSKAAAGNA